MTIRYAPWQRAFAGILFNFLGFVSTAAALKAVWPERITFIKADTPAFLLGSGLAVTLLALAGWWHTERYALRADERGITQNTGFGKARVLWADVASFRRQETGSGRGTLCEPVLYDRAGNEIFRPAAPLLVPDSATLAARALFWQYVERQLPGKGLGLFNAPPENNADR